MGSDDFKKEGQETRKSGLAIAGLILGILGFFTAGVSAIAGLIISIIALFQIKLSKGKVTGYRLAIAGIVVPIVVITLFCSIMLTVSPRRDLRARKICATNLALIWKAMSTYENEHGGKYPPVDQWCDLLEKQYGMTQRQFVCLSAKEDNYSYTTDSNSPNDRIFLYKDPNGRHFYKKRSYYSLNPNAEPNSPADLVLIFESKGGWNQFGGMELVAPQNHRGRGCNVLFNDGHVNFVRTKDLKNLRWKAERK